jgi:hypothetical protein
MNISEEKVDPALAIQSQALPAIYNYPAAQKTAPANPQPKKIGEAYGDMAEKQAQTTAALNKQNLQDAISTIIPEKLRASLPGQATKASDPTVAVNPSVPVPATQPLHAEAALTDQRFPAYPSTTAKPQTLNSAPSASNIPIVPTVQTTSPMTAKPPKISSDPNIKPLRTYESDVADVLSHRNISQASMTIAENKRKRGEERIGTTPAGIPSTDIPARDAPTASGADAIREASGPPSHAGRKLTLVILSLILVAGGIFGGYYLYKQSPLAAPAPQPTAPQQPQSVIKAGSQSVIAIDGLNANAIASKIRTGMAKPQAPNTVEEIVLAETQNGALVRASPADVLNAMGIAPPDMLVRTLQPEWMLGTYADASGTKSLFVIAETDFFQNAFAGMLQWEATMPFDLQPYLYAQATSTVIQGRFEDRIVKNADVREFTAADGQTPFLYSFIDSSKLVVAGNEAALSEIIGQLEQQAFIR